MVVEQLERLTAEVAGLRDELRVQGAMIRRLDVGQTAVREEMRAILDQVARMNDRIRRLEDAS